MKFRNDFEQIFTPIEKLPRPALVFLVAMIVAAMQLPVSVLMHSVSLGLGVAINEILVILGIPVLFVYFLKLDARALFPHTKPQATTWAALSILTLGFVIIVDFLTATSDAVWPLPEKYQKIMDAVMSISSGSEYIYKLAILCLLPGVCEEIFFRGFCQTSLYRWKGAVNAIIASGILFAILHGNPWQAHLYFVLGCFLGWTYYVSGTLIVPIACHIFNNAWTLTHHALGTTLPIKEFGILINAAILFTGIVFLIFGGIHFKRLSVVRYPLSAKTKNLK